MNDPTLHDYRWVVVNSSGGKDSQVALDEVVRLADKAGYPREQIVVSHQDLGDMEWEGTKSLASRQALHYGLRFEVTRYRNKEGNELSLLDYVRKRGKWPDNKNRYCTSDFKRGPGGRVITALSREAEGNVLNVFGFRAEESPARAKRDPFVANSRLSTKTRKVFDWLPIHDWTEDQVWNRILETGAPYHPAYSLGMPRLSCVFCVFAPKAALMIAGRENPGLLDRYIEIEQEIGHDFQNGKPLSKIKEAIQMGDVLEDLDGQWNM